MARLQPKVGDKVRILNINGIYTDNVVKISSDLFEVEEILPMPLDEYPDGVSVTLKGVPFLLHEIDVEVVELAP